MIIEAARLARSFRGRRVLGPLDLQVGCGERLALTGPNGSGKSTLLRCIAGTVAPTSGTVTVAGRLAGSRQARRAIGCSLAQERSFYLRLSGRQNLLTFARMRESPRRALAAVTAVIDELAIEEIADRRVDRCSTGMVQQLALARALLGEPRVLLLDEPTRSLDEGAVERLWAAVDHRPELTLLIATHRPEDVERCERHLALGLG